MATLRVAVALLLMAVMTNTGQAQFRRGPGRLMPPLRLPLPGRVATIQVPYGVRFGTPFAPITYFNPPVTANGYPLVAPGAYFYPGQRLGGVGRSGRNFQQGGYYYFSNGVQYRVSSNVMVRPGQNSGLVTNKPLAPNLGKQAARPVEIEPPPVNVQLVGAGDPVAAKRFQDEGDTLLRTNQFNRAFNAYTASIDADGTRPDPYYRLAVLFSAMRRYEPAIRYLKQGLDFAPEFAKTGGRLADIYGVGRSAQRQQNVQTIVSRAKVNLKDPDTQLLAGAMLHFDNQQRAAATYLERAVQISQRPSRATALLSARDVDIPESPPASGDSLILSPEPEPEPATLPPPLLPPAPEPIKLPTPQKLELPAKLPVPPSPEEADSVTDIAPGKTAEVPEDPQP